MPIIKVNKAFTYAIRGNHVVEFLPGVHEVSDEIAKVATKQLKVAVEAKDKANLMPPIYEDINGYPLSGEDLRHLDPTFMPPAEDIESVEVLTSSNQGDEVLPSLGDVGVNPDIASAPTV